MPYSVAKHSHMHRIKEIQLIQENGEVRFPLGERKAVMDRLPPGMNLPDDDPLFDVAGGGDDEN